MRNFEVWRSIVREAFDKTSIFIKLFCCVHVTREYLLDVVFVPGPSMLPTMNITGPGDIVLVDRLSPRLGKISRGDIVIIRSPENPRKLITKRLTAAENDSFTYLVDPKNNDKLDSTVSILREGNIVTSRSAHTSLKHDILWEYRRGTYGYREITYMLQEIQEPLGLFLTVFSTEKYFGEFGQLNILDDYDQFPFPLGKVLFFAPFSSGDLNLVLHNSYIFEKALPFLS